MHPENEFLQESQVSLQAAVTDPLRNYHSDLLLIKSTGKVTEAGCPESIQDSHQNGYRVLHPPAVQPLDLTFSSS